ncbi:hypothetical protein BDK51DRAFT_24706, partial [Blyttiomyces helicus]
QVLVARQRFGYDGNGTSIGQTYRTYGIGYVAAHLYTSTVIQAIFRQALEWVQWPDQDKRAEMAKHYGE